MIPQIIVIVIWVLSLMLASYMHGKPQTGTHNVLNTIISIALTFGLLWSGGFFKPWF